MSDSHGERDTQRLFRKHGLTLGIPVSKCHVGANEDKQPVDVPFLKVSDTLRVLLNKHPKLLFGGFDVGTDAEDLCSLFWDRYKYFHPQHEVYKYSASERRRVLPILLHGDKGRGYQKSPVFILDWETPFSLPAKMRQAGSKADQARQNRAQAKQAHGGRLSWSCAERARHAGEQCIPAEEKCGLNRRHKDNGRAFEALGHNGKGNSLLSKFLIAAVPSKVFKGNPSVMVTVHQEVAADLKELFTAGVTSRQGHCFRAAVVGCKGDAEYHVEAGAFERHYARVGTAHDWAMCPYCWAGLPGLSFTDMSDSPPWTRTIDASVPWDADAEPALLQVPFSGSWGQARFFRRDMFHTLKYGICRDLVAGVLFLLADMKYFDSMDAGNESRSIDARLERGFSLFKLWCFAESRNTSLKHFTPQSLHRKKAHQFPWLGGKGSDAILCMMFLAHFVSVCLRDLRDESHVTLLRAVRETLTGGLNFVGIMHSHDLFLNPTCAAYMHSSGLTLLRGYVFLAHTAMSQSLRLFSLRPKLHYFAHTLWELQGQLESNDPHIMSPSIFNCESNEDLVGKIARLSRRVSPRMCSQRVLDRYQVLCHLLFRRASV